MFFQVFQGYYLAARHDGNVPAIVVQTLDGLQGADTDGSWPNAVDANGRVYSDHGLPAGTLGGHGGAASSFPRLLAQCS